MHDVQLKGSYTIEAALTIPILLFVMLIGMKTGLSLYQDICREREQDAVMQVWAVKEFYRNQWIREGWDDK